MHDDLNDRAQQLLKALIEKHIADGQPVGSKTLVKDSALSLSPATVRNVLAELEEKGFLSSPHHSAGRVPTALGYRFFVDSLLKIKPLNPETVAAFEKQLPSKQSSQELINSASSLLSTLTHMVGVVTLPNQSHFLLSHIEFLPLAKQRVLAILVFNNKEVQNRIIETERDYSREELTQLGNYLNEHYFGYDFSTVRKHIYEAMRIDKDKMNDLMQQAINIADKVFLDAAPEKDYVVAGQNNLIRMTPNPNLDHLAKLFSAFTQKQELLDLLARCLNTQGIQIFIGAESHYQAFGECSIITSNYTIDDQPIGVLGIIGPTRMPYDKIIPIVDVTAKILSSALNK